MKFMVAFSSPKRSARTVEVASQHAKALGAELILMRVVPDPEKVGVIAQLIASDRPEERAQAQIDQVIAELKSQGIDAKGIVRKGEVSPGIIKEAQEQSVDLLFVGTTDMQKKPFFMMAKDPIVHYLVDHCPISLCLVRQDPVQETGEFPRVEGQY